MLLRCSSERPLLREDSQPQAAVTSSAFSHPEPLEKRAAQAAFFLSCRTQCPKASRDEQFALQSRIARHRVRGRLRFAAMKLIGLRRSRQSRRGRIAAGHNLRDLIEIASAHEALVRYRPITKLLRRELLLLQLGISGHASLR